MTEEPAYFVNKMYTTHGDFDLYYFTLSNYTGLSIVSNCRLRRLWRSKINPPWFIGEGYIANFPVIEGDYSTDLSGEFYSATRTAEIDSNYFCNGSEFGLTTMFTIGHARSEEGDSLVVHISKNIGIVKRELPEHNEIWKLVERTILQ